jgi:uncharacterized protein GlcG (DUF336 family)
MRKTTREARADRAPIEPFKQKWRHHVHVIEKNSISSELAQRMVEAVLVKARAIGVPENVAVLDDGGNLKAFARMDGAPILSIEISQHKAYTALFGFATQDFSSSSRPIRRCWLESHNFHGSRPGGGLPIEVDGAIVGAIGVSGGTVQNDIDCAEAGLAVIKR